MHFLFMLKLPFHILETKFASDVPLAGLALLHETTLAFWYVGGADAIYALTTPPVEWLDDAEASFNTVSATSPLLLVRADEKDTLPVFIDPRPGDLHAVEDTATELLD